MTDTAEQAPTTETKPEKPVKVPVQPHDCLCSSFQLFNPKDKDEVFEPECGLTTKSKFAQGHDAKLVSFLVGGVADGYSIRQVVDGKATTFPTPAAAVAHISEPLRVKAEKATANAESKANDKAANAERRAKLKEERATAAAARKAEAAKAKAEKPIKEPKATGAAVVAGSREGDTTDLAEGEAIIKVGKFEFRAVVDAEGNATYSDGAGEIQVRPRDAYQLLRAYEAPAA